MSGGTFDYIQYRIHDAVEEIQNRIRKNHKTIQENWDEISEEERKQLWDYERPWTLLEHPYWVNDEAEKIANKEFGIEGCSFLNGIRQKTFNDLKKKQKDKWSEIYHDSIQKMIEDHNNSPIGSDYSDETIAKIQKMLVTIQKAEIYLNRIDWLFAGDDGEDNFAERTKEDLNKAGLTDD